ncbi:DUF6541 family protein, partial [Arsenicicoccus sp. UBA6765]
ARRRLGWLAVAAGAAVGLALVHPSALLSLLVLALPLLVPAVWRQLRDVTRRHPQARRAATWGAAVGLAVTVVGVVLVARTPTVQRLLVSRARTVTDPGDAVR